MAVTKMPAPMKTTVVLVIREWWDALKLVERSVVPAIFNATQLYLDNAEAKTLRAELLTRPGDDKRKRFAIWVDGVHRAVGCHGHHHELVWEWVGPEYEYEHRYGKNTKARTLADTRFMPDKLEAWLRHLPEQKTGTPEPKKKGPPQGPTPRALAGGGPADYALSLAQAENRRLTEELDAGARLLAQESGARAALAREVEELKRRVEVERKRGGVRPLELGRTQNELQRTLEMVREDRNRLDTHNRDLLETVRRQKARIEEENARALRAEKLVAQQQEGESKEAHAIRAEMSGQLLRNEVELEVTKRQLTRREEEVVDLRVAAEFMRAGLRVLERVPVPAAASPPPPPPPPPPVVQLPTPVAEGLEVVEEPAPPEAPGAAVEVEAPAEEEPTESPVPPPEVTALRKKVRLGEAERLALEVVKKAGEEGITTNDAAKAIRVIPSNTLRALVELRDHGKVRCLVRGRLGATWYLAKAGEPARKVNKLPTDRPLTSTEAAALTLLQEAKGGWVSTTDIAKTIGCKVVTVGVVVSWIRRLTGAVIEPAKGQPDRPKVPSYRLKEAKV